MEVNVITNKRKNLISIIIFVSILMFSFSITSKASQPNTRPTNSNQYNTMPTTNAYTFYNYLDGHSELDKTKAAYNPNDGYIRFVTHNKVATRVRGGAYYYTLGYQLTLEINGTTYRTSFREASSRTGGDKNGPRAMTLGVHTYKKDGDEHVANMMTLSAKTMMEAFEQEFPEIQRKDWDRVDLSRARFDAMLTKDSHNHNLYEYGRFSGKLTENRALPEGEVWITPNGVEVTPGAKVSHSRLITTAADRRDRGAVNMHNWSSPIRAKQEVRSRYNIAILAPKTDLKNDRIVMIDKLPTDTNRHGAFLNQTEMEGLTRDKYIKGQPFYLAFRLTHINGWASVGRVPPLNHQAGLHFNLLEDYGGTPEDNRRNPKLDTSVGSHNKQVHLLHENGTPLVLSPRNYANQFRSLVAGAWVTAGPFVIDEDDSFIADTELLHSLHQKFLNNRLAENNITTVRFEAEIEEDLALDTLALFDEDDKIVRNNRVKPGKTYSTKLYFSHLEGRDEIENPNPTINVTAIDEGNVSRLKREDRTIEADRKLGLKRAIRMYSGSFTVGEADEAKDINYKATISKVHDKVNKIKTNDTVTDVFFVERPDLSLKKINVYNKDGAIVTGLIENEEYKAEISMKHEFGDEVVTNPVIKTVIKDKKGEILYNKEDVFHGDLHPEKTINIETGYFKPGNSNLTITSSIVRNKYMDQYNQIFDNDTVTRDYSVEEVVDDYYIKSFTSSTPSIVLPSTQDAIRNVSFTVDIGHRLSPIKSGSRTPNLVLKQGGNIIWDGSVYIPNNGSNKVNINAQARISTGVNNFTIEVNENRAIEEKNFKVDNPYLDNKSSYRIDASYANNESLLYARTKWSKDMGYNDLPSHGPGWMSVGNGGKIKVKAGNGFEVVFKTEFDYSPGSRERYISDNEKSNTRIVVPFMNLSLNNTYDNGSAFNTRRDYQIPNRRVVNGVSERKIYTRLSDKPNTHKIDIKSNRTTTIQSYTVHTSCSTDGEGNTSCYSWRNYYTFPVYSNNDDHFYLEILPQDDLKSHIMR